MGACGLNAGQCLCVGRSQLPDQALKQLHDQALKQAKQLKRPRPFLPALRSPFLYQALMGICTHSHLIRHAQSPQRLRQISHSSC